VNVYYDFETVSAEERYVYSYSYAINDEEPQYYFHSGVLDKYVVLEHFINTIFDKLARTAPKMRSYQSTDTDVLLLQSIDAKHRRDCVIATPHSEETPHPTRCISRVWLKAWNGAKFDFCLLMPYLLSRTGFSPMKIPGLALPMDMKYWCMKYIHQNRDVVQEFRIIMADPKLYTPGLSLTQAVWIFSKLTPAMFQGIKLAKEEFSHEDIQRRFRSTKCQYIPLTETEKEKACLYNIQDVILLRAMCLSFDTIFSKSIKNSPIPSSAFSSLKSFIIKSGFRDMIYPTGGNHMFFCSIDEKSLDPFVCFGSPKGTRDQPLKNYYIIGETERFPSSDDILQMSKEGKKFITTMVPVGTREGYIICSNILAAIVELDTFILDECVFRWTLVIDYSEPDLPALRGASACA
jgi:hypothetical protein